MEKKNIYKIISKSVYWIFLSAIIIIGLFLRIRLYCLNLPIWDDEAAVGWFILDLPFYKLFTKLNYVAAPQFWLIANKLLTQIFGSSLLTLRFISLFAGCTSLLLFLSLLNKIFKSKIAIILSLFLFSFCNPLIYYSQELKPYELDVFFCILLLLISDKIKLTNTKKDILISLGVFLMTFCSFPSIFILFSIIFIQILSSEKIEKIRYILFLFIPFCISNILQWIIQHNTHAQILTCADWFNGYFSLSFSSFYKLLHTFFDYINWNTILILTFLIIGFLCSIVSKNKIIYISLMSILGIVLASYLHLYPFVGRAILFLIPIFIIFIGLVFDSINIKNNKIFTAIEFIIFLIFLSIFIRTTNPKSLLFDINYTIYNDGINSRIERTEIVNTILDNYKNKTDAIICSQEFFLFLKFYNLLDKYNYNLDYCCDCNNFDIIENNIANKEHNYWIINYYNPYEDSNIDYNNKYKSIYEKTRTNYKIFETKHSQVIYYIENIKE